MIQSIHTGRGGLPDFREEERRRIVWWHEVVLESNKRVRCPVPEGLAGVGVLIVELGVVVESLHVTEWSLHDVEELI